MYLFAEHLRLMINFKQLEIKAGTEEGARYLFQDLIAHIIQIKHKNAKEIRAAPGDWGIDVFIGNLTSGTCLVWQAKYFPNGIDKSQQKQINDSFQQVVSKGTENSFIIDAWHLCVPCDLSAKEMTWWEKWKKKNEKKTEIKIVLMERIALTSLLMTPEAESICKHYNLGTYTTSYKEHKIHELPDEISSEYDNSLFIKKLVVAGITENMSARSQFFNAELIKREIHDKGDEDELNELISLYEKIHSMWESRFNEALTSSNPLEETRKVYNNMLISIEQFSDDRLKSPKIAASFFHKQGFMQQLADICKVGWSPNFHQIDDEFDNNG